MNILPPASEVIWLQAAANVADVNRVDRLLHGQENVFCADAVTPSGINAPSMLGGEVIWQVEALRSGYKYLRKHNAPYMAKCKIEKARAQTCVQVERSL